MGTHRYQHIYNKVEKDMHCFHVNFFCDKVKGYNTLGKLGLITQTSTIHKKGESQYVYSYVFLSGLNCIVQKLSCWFYDHYVAEAFLNCS